MTRRHAITATLFLLVAGPLAACSTPSGPDRAPDAPATASVAPAASAAPTAQPDAVGLRPLVGTTWVVSPPTGLVPPGADRPLLRLGPDGRFLAHDGCTTLSGTWQGEGDALTVDVEATSAIGCPEHPHQDFVRALEAVTTADVTPLGLALGAATGETLLTFHPIVHTDAPAPAGVELRVRNGTGRDLASVDVVAWGGRMSFGALPAGAASDYVVPPGEVARYAGLELAFTDGERAGSMATDYVGETALPPGRYTYVLVRQPDIGVVAALEEGPIRFDSFR